MTGAEIRNAFITYFKSKGHKEVRSSSLVPHNDPTILFTNAGMNQFKDVFLGNEAAAYPCAVTAQKVLRAGGKHNDLENVGRTDRHHTFFEMLGNFSFGDYFKKEAIRYAWEFLTEVLRLDTDKLAVSVYEKDEESFGLWRQDIGIPEERIARLGEKDNFWSMGDTGPCGPCSEIHYHLRPLVEGRTPRESLEADDGSFLEVWNLVFMQYNRGAQGRLNPLPKPSIDTGMGLERIASVVQGKVTNYDSDLLYGLTRHIAQGAGHRLHESEEVDVSCRVIADHIRACVFLIADGVAPANEGRGYVLRRVLRRAARHGKELGYSPGFFSDLAAYFIPLMAPAYPEIAEAQDLVQILLKREEQRFAATLTQGMKILDELLEQQKQAGSKDIHGAEIFKLYDTYGFPPDLAEDILIDRGYAYSKPQFEQAMTEQRRRAKAAQNTRGIDLRLDKAYQNLTEQNQESRFVGYERLEVETEILAILQEGNLTQEIHQGDLVEVWLKETPFYAEGGGQVGDRGEIEQGDFLIQVAETQSLAPGLSIAKGQVAQVIGQGAKVSKGEPVIARVDAQRRRATERNHTATHLLQAALRQVVGEHVKQAGSLVTPEKLRFDFSHYAPLTPVQIQDIEELVNKAIRANEPVSAQIMGYDQALRTGAMAIFGEKYGDSVRVITAGKSSKEFCGGCHVSATGNIGMFKIVGEEAISAGVRRIEALTGRAGLAWTQRRLGQLEQIASQLKVGLDQVEPRFAQLLAQLKEKEKGLEAAQKELSRLQAGKALERAQEINGVKLLALKLAEEANLKQVGPEYLAQLGSGLVMLSKEQAGKASVMLLVSKDLTDHLQAGKLIAELAPLIQARGGGKPEFAQCGGGDPAGLEEFKAGLISKLKEVFK